jgi:hypothetical protein
VSLSPHVRGEYPVDDVSVAQGLDGQSRDGRFGAERGQGRQQFVIRPGLELEQALQCAVHGVLHVMVS